MDFQRIPGESALARKRRLFRRFVAGNRFELDNIVEDVAFRDEYEIGDCPFEPGDVILDIGAHIGVFSYLCYVLGSRAVHAYEPGERNFALLRHNLGALPGVHLTNAAVWKSEPGIPGTMTISGPDGDNTGSQTLLWEGRILDFSRQTVSSVPGARLVPTIALDQIIEKVCEKAGRVKLLKLDCEGSEFPILLTSQKLRQVERIVAEVHEIDDAVVPELAPGTLVPGLSSYRREDLVNHLEADRFQVRVKAGSPRMAWIDARRSPEECGVGFESGSAR